MATETDSHRPVQPESLEGQQTVNDQRVLDGRYEVGELLGRGGMADVYLGRDIRLGRRVAIKLLRADLARDPLFQSRFRREAQAVAALNHPTIVSIFDTGENPADGDSDLKVPFIVMEYVAGRTLRELIQGKDVTIDQAVDYTLGVLSALEYSHRAGIVHRDIKPANVMVTPDGGVKVMDFGIARAIADSAATMTQTQAVVGTAQYLSPEQARGETVDARSDLYSAACLLYEMLTGRPPFVGDSPVSVAYQHVREVPEPASKHNPELSAAMDSVLARALQKDREDRFADAAGFRAALLAAHGRTPEPGHPAAPSHAPGMAAGAAGLAAGLSAGAAAGPADRSDAGTEALPAHPSPVDRNPAEHSPAGRVPTSPMTAPTAAFGAPQTAGAASGDAGRMSGPAATQAYSTARDYPDEQDYPAERDYSAEQGYSAERDFAAHQSPEDGSAWNGPQTQSMAAAGAVGAAAAAPHGDRPRTDGVPTALAVGNSNERSPEQRAKRRAWITTLAIALVLVLGAGAYVLYTLTRPPATVAVPEVTGKSQAEAMNMITTADLRPFIEQVHHDTIQSGNAIGTDPAAGAQLELNSQVTLRVSTGPSAVVIPADLAGKTEAQVRDILRSLNLVGDETATANSATVPRDMLISTNPALGSKIAVGSTVNLVISTGQVTMPNLVEMSRAEAEAALQDPAVALPYRFQEVENSVVPAGTVTNQNVPGGSNVDQGTEILVTVARAPAPPPSPTPSPTSSPTSTATSGAGNGNSNSNSGNNENANSNPDRGNRDEDD
jgi:eukaryotic-like serine/threonine-protein kinase